MNRSNSITSARRTSKAAKPPRSDLPRDCWVDLFEQPTFGGRMRRIPGPADVPVNHATPAIGSMIVGPTAAVIAFGQGTAPGLTDGKMIVQFAPRQIVEDFKKVGRVSEIRWLRVLEIPSSALPKSRKTNAP